MASDVSFGPHNGFVSAAPHRALLPRQRALRACVWGLVSKTCAAVLPGSHVRAVLADTNPSLIASTLLSGGVCIAQRALHLGFQLLQLRFNGIIERFFAFALAVNNWFRGALVTLLRLG